MIPVSTAAARYLDQWFLVEAPIRTRLLSNRAAEQLQGVAGAAGFFKVARNLPRAYDELRGIPRYEPVRAAVADLHPAAAEDPDLLVPAFARRLSELYGGRGALSFASKILWVRFRDPVVIYDSKARQALGARVGDYPAFRARWEARWQQEAPAIAEACNGLGSAFGEAQCAPHVPEAEISDALAAPWFHRRVLDVLLWYEGGEAGAHRRRGSRGASEAANVARKSVTPSRHIGVTARVFTGPVAPALTRERTSMHDLPKLFDGFSGTSTATALRLRPLLEQAGAVYYPVNVKKQARVGWLRAKNVLLATLTSREQGLLLTLRVGSHSRFMAPQGPLQPRRDDAESGGVLLQGEAIPEWLPACIGEAVRYTTGRFGISPSGRMT